jgi:hypothetical protein
MTEFVPRQGSAGLERSIIAGFLEIETDHHMIHLCGLNEDRLICWSG